MIYNCERERKKRKNEKLLSIYDAPGGKTTPYLVEKQGLPPKMPKSVNNHFNFG